jgi:hypothetical protein
LYLETRRGSPNTFKAILNGTDVYGFICDDFTNYAVVAGI